MSDDLDPEDRALIARLRALPTEGTEPGWDQFGRELARKLEAAPPRPWWRRWWAPALGATLAVAAAGAVVVLWPQPSSAPVVIAEILHDAAPAPVPVPTPPRPSRPGDAILALGSEGEIDDADLDLDDEDVIAGVMEALDDGEGAEDDEDEGDDLAALGDVPEDPIEGLVPDLDLDWVDELEEEDLDAVTAWLEDEAG